MYDPTSSRYRYLAFSSPGYYRRYISNKEEKKIEYPDLTMPETQTPAHGSYAEALFRPEWKLKRDEIIRRDGSKCVLCRATEPLQVHHRQYHFVVSENKFRLPWEYSSHLMITLCDSCHRRGHSKFKVPIINI